MTLKKDGSLTITIPETSDGDYEGLFGYSHCDAITATGKLPDGWDGMNQTAIQNGKVTSFTERSSGMVDLLNRSTTHTPGGGASLSFSFQESTLVVALSFDCKYSGWYMDSRELENGELESFEVPTSGSESHKFTISVPMTPEQAQSFSWRET